MATLAAAVPYIMAAGTVVAATSSIQEGRYQKDLGEYQAKVQEQQANEEAAASQRRALAERNQSQRIMSRAQAIAAASGGGADDVTIQNLMGDLESEGEYNAMAELYSGQSQSQSLRAQAGASRMAGRAARSRGVINSVGTIIDGGTSLYAKYGDIDGKKPKKSERRKI